MLANTFSNFLKQERTQSDLSMHLSSTCFALSQPTTKAALYELTLIVNKWICENELINSKTVFNEC